VKSRSTYSNNILWGIVEFLNVIAGGENSYHCAAKMLFASPADVTQYDHDAQVMTQREDYVPFKESRIWALQEDWQAIGKKTFTKWMNSYLLTVRYLLFAFPLFCVQNE